jgi:hypothetical protein
VKEVYKQVLSSSASAIVNSANQLSITFFGWWISTQVLLQDIGTHLHPEIAA